MDIKERWGEFLEAMRAGVKELRGEAADHEEQSATELKLANEAREKADHLEAMIADIETKILGGAA